MGAISPKLMATSQSTLWLIEDWNIIGCGVRVTRRLSQSTLWLVEDWNELPEIAYARYVVATNFMVGWLRIGTSNILKRMYYG